MRYGTSVKRLINLLGMLGVGIVPLLSASADAKPERPVVFVPGILGSKLVDPAGRVVWGERSSLRNFAELEIGNEAPAKPLVADGLIASINVLGPFWVVHQYDALLEMLRKLDYVEGTTLFVFPYDWRQSNFETAKKLEAFIANSPVLKTGKFDLVAHSMGGIAAKIWMLEYGGAARVNKAIFLGTPFQGSANALATISNGWGGFANYLAGGVDTVRRVVLSLPSIYELLPTYARCCRLGNADQHVFLDILQAPTWYSRDWLPPMYRPGGERATRFTEGLNAARRVGALMRREVSGVPQIRFAGDAMDTKLWLYVSNDQPSWKNWSFTNGRGDGTVPVWSAANDFNTLAGSDPSFVEHATIFSDKWVGNKLSRELASLPPPPRTTDPSGITKELELVGIELDPLIAAPGEPVRISVRIDFAEPVARGDAPLTGGIVKSKDRETPFALTETTSAADLANRRLAFSGSLRAPDDEGTFRIDVNFPGHGIHSSYLTTLAAPTTGQ
jgi:pimeloyl-ACP methyl ester carboxylesterase